jgi:hypothetical protein
VDSHRDIPADLVKVLPAAHTLVSPGTENPAAHSWGERLVTAPHNQDTLVKSDKLDRPDKDSAAPPPFLRLVPAGRRAAAPVK